MKKCNPFRSTIDRYREAGYSTQTIDNLHYLESRCEHLGDFLEDYRRLQPDGDVFSEESLAIIMELNDLKERIGWLEDTIANLQNRLGDQLKPQSQDEYEELF